MRKKLKVFVAGHKGMLGSAILKKLKKKNIFKVFYETKKNLNLLNQKQVDAYIRDTSVYVFNANNFLNGKNLLYGKKKFAIFTLTTMEI